MLLLCWVTLAWLDKQGIGHHDDGYDAGSAAAAAAVAAGDDEDELAPYAQASAADKRNTVLQ